MNMHNFLHSTTRDVRLRITLALRWTNQAILSQEAYGILLLLLHSNRIDCCLSPRCV